VAKNKLTIEKAQESLGECSSCCLGAEQNGASFEASPEDCAACKNACSLINLEQINVGARTAIASGPSTTAENEVTIKTLQH